MLTILAAGLTAGSLASVRSVPTVAEGEIPVIDDACDTIGAKTTDCYSMAIQTGDVGFGTDSRFVSTYSKATAAPNASTMWSDFGYIQYAVSGQNTLTVVCDEGLECTAPLVWAEGPKTTLEASVSVQTSSNWARRTYTYALPSETTWVRILPSVYEDAATGMANWVQQITNVRLEYLEAPVTITDECTDPLAVGSMITDFYKIRNGKVGEDGVYLSNSLASVEPTPATWWSEDYGYVQYALDRQNFVTIDCLLSEYGLDHLPTSLLYTGTGNGRDLKAVALNNRVVGELADGYYPVSYRFAIDTDKTIGRICFPTYVSPDGKIDQSSLQITKVVIESLKTIPAADEVDHTFDAQVEALTTYYGTLDSTLYSATNWALITYTINMAKYDVLKAADVTAAEAIIASAKAAVDDILTITEEFEAAKAAEIKRLNDFKATLVETDYTAENWAAIGKIVTDALAEIETTTDIEAIKQIVDDSIEDMKAVATKPVDPPTSSSEPGTSSSEPGSSSSISSSSSAPASSSTGGKTSSSSSGTTTGGGGCGGSIVGTTVATIVASIGVVGIAFLRKKKH